MPYDGFPSFFFVCFFQLTSFRVLPSFAECSYLMERSKTHLRGFLLVLPSFFVTEFLIAMKGTLFSNLLEKKHLIGLCYIKWARFDRIFLLTRLWGFSTVLPSFTEFLMAKKDSLIPNVLANRVHLVLPSIWIWWKEKSRRWGFLLVLPSFFLLPSFRSSVAHGSTLEEAHDFVWRRVSRGRRRGDFTVFLFSASASDETAVPFRRPPSLFISLAVSMADCFSFSSSSPFFFYSVSRERERERMYRIFSIWLPSFTGFSFLCGLISSSPRHFCFPGTKLPVWFVYFCFPFFYWVFHFTGSNGCKFVLNGWLHQ